MHTTVSRLRFLGRLCTLLVLCPWAGFATGAQAAAPFDCPGIVVGDNLRYWGGVWNGPNMVNRSAMIVRDTTGRVHAWGGAEFGGTGAPSRAGFIATAATTNGLAALHSDGSVVSWGNPQFNSGAPSGTGYVGIYSTRYGYAALHESGTIASWGLSSAMGTPPSGSDFVALASNSFSFAALDSDGRISAWGNALYGGSGAPTRAGYAAIAASANAFAALHSDGTIDSWGDAYHTDNAPVDGGYRSIVSTNQGFTALKRDGSVRAWGQYSDNAPSGTGFLKLFVNSDAYAALRADGSIATWGRALFGGSGGPSRSGYVDIVSNDNAFAALHSDGTVTAWGHTWGGDSAPSGQFEAVFAATLGFIAIDADGRLHYWGGASSHDVPTGPGFVTVSSNNSAAIAVRADGSYEVWGNADLGGTRPHIDNPILTINARALDDHGERDCRPRLPPTATFDSDHAPNDADEDSAWHFSPKTAVATGVSVRFSATGLPDWIDIDAATGALSGTPDNDDVGTTSGVELHISDDDGVQDTLVFDLRVLNRNDPPAVDAGIDQQSADEDTAYSFDVPADAFTDIDTGDTLSYTAASLPAWLSFDGQTFTGTPTNADVGTVLIKVTASDGDGASASTDFDLAVVNRNDAPAVDAGIGAQSATEDGLFSFTVPTAAFVDPDLGDTLAYTLTAGPTWLSISGDRLSGTPAQGDVGTATVTLRATDGAGLHAQTDFEIRVAELNDEAPRFTSAASASATENATGTVYTATASDPDSGDSIRFTVEGEDAARFAIEPSTGALSFLAPPDFENPDDAGADRRYAITLRATDEAGQSSTLALSITLLDANDNAPRFSSAARAATPEGSTATGYRASAVDPEAGDTLRFDIAGGDDGALFEIDSGSGVLHFRQPADYEAPADADADNRYHLLLRVRDAADNQSTLALLLSVTDAGDNAPLFTSATSASFDENRTDTGYRAAAVDSDPGDTLRYAIAGGDDAALFHLDADTGALHARQPLDRETPIDADGDGVYQLRLSATDPIGLSTTLDLSLRVDDLNDTAPVISSALAIAIGEDNLAAGYTATASDPDRADAPPRSLRYSLVGGADRGLFTIAERTGVLTFNDAPDFESPDDHDGDHRYHLRLRVTDRAEQYSERDLVITLSDADDTAPAFSSAATATIEEGHLGPFYTAVATDPDSSDSARFAIAAGNGAGLFSIDPVTGVLSADGPDFEQPGAGAANNVYTLTLRASDSGGNSKDYALAVTVDDLNDNPPRITSAAQLSLAENSVGTVYTATASDPDSGDALRWAIEPGGDAARFAVDPASGALRFAAAPDFEQPGDGDADNRYAITLRVNDAGGHASTLDLAIAVTDLDEPPAAADQHLAISEFAAPGTVVGHLSAADPEGAALHWQLLDRSPAFTLSASGVLSTVEALDFETTPRYTLAVEVSDGSLAHALTLTVELRDESEVARLLEALPVATAELRQHGVRGAESACEDYYNAALNDARPRPSTLDALQQLIDRANATAAAVGRGHCDSGSGSGSSGGESGTGGEQGPSPLIGQLHRAGVTAPVAANADCYASAIDAAAPSPLRSAELSRIVERVDADVALIETAAAAHRERTASAPFAALLRERTSALEEELFAELAALIDRHEPPLRCHLDLGELIDELQTRAAEHPVLYLKMEQDGVAIQRARRDGGPISIRAVIANPVPGATLRFDWTQSEAALLEQATEVRPLTETLHIDPAALPGRELIAQLAIDRDGLRANAQIAVQLLPDELDPALGRDADADGVLDAFEGELEASTDPATANRLQTVAGDDLSHVMQSPPGTVLRLGAIARAALANQSAITLDQIVEHQRGASAALVIDSLPGDSGANAQIYDYEAAALPRAGMSTPIALPLKAPLESGASYFKFHPASGWTPFVEDGLNSLASAPALGGLLGHCPPPGHAAYSPGLAPGHSCLQLRIEDGGPNDADRLLHDGSAAPDGGLNGNLVDLGAVIYVNRAALSGAPGDGIRTGVQGGAMAWPVLGCLFALFATRRRGRRRGRGLPSS